MEVFKIKFNIIRMSESKSIESMRSEFINCVKVHLCEIDSIEKLDEIRDKCLKSVDPENKTPSIYKYDMIEDIVTTV